MQTMDKNQFGVVFVQMHVTDNKLWNMKHAERLVRDAVARFEPRIVVLPEYFSTPMYAPNADFVRELSEEFPAGETFVRMAQLARELGVYLVGGSMIERAGRQFYNTTAVFSPMGEPVAHYRKMHLFSMVDMERQTGMRQAHFDEHVKSSVMMNESTWFEAGHQLATFDVDGVRFGLGLGYDMNFAEFALMHRKQGVEVLIVPSALPTMFGRQHWEQMLRVRSIDNQMYVLGAAQAAMHSELFYGMHAERTTTGDLLQPPSMYQRQLMTVPFGSSMLVDYRGHVLKRAAEDEELLFAHVNVSELRAYRKHFAMFEHKRSDVYETMMMTKKH